MRVFFTNLGCKLNQAETERLAREFTAAGHRVVGSLAAADLHVINSCTVTHRAARDSRKAARSGGRRRPRVATVLTGCYASDRPAEAGDLPGVDLVVTNERKEHLLSLVHERFGRAPEAPPEAPATLPYGGPGLGHTRAAVKVEDGCNMRCAFCIIPSTRGRQSSRPLPEVVAEVDGLARTGAREVILTGVQISHYGWQGRKLYDLVAAILAETPLPRLRLTSLAPWAFDDRLLDLLAGPRLCRHVHLSLQSGCDATLARMRRPYTAAAYADLVARIRAAVPGVGVTTDVIAGFPGETEEEHAESLAFVTATGFARVHVFPFSPRPGTEAATLPGAVAPAALRRRTAALLRVAAESERRFRESQLGKTVSVLWQERRGGVWHGVSDNYLKVTAADPAPLANRLTPARLLGLGGETVRAEVTAERPPGPALHVLTG